MIKSKIIFCYCKNILVLFKNAKFLIYFILAKNAFAFSRLLSQKTKKKNKFFILNLNKIKNVRKESISKKFSNFIKIEILLFLLINRKDKKYVCVPVCLTSYKLLHINVCFAHHLNSLKIP
jgi:hypothetical protein